MAKTDTKRVYDCGTAATKLVELLGEPLNLVTLQKMREQVSALAVCEASPTLNVTRLWTALNAVLHLSTGNVAEYVATMSFWPRPQKGTMPPSTDPLAPDMLENLFELKVAREGFDMETPELWRLLPTQDEYDDAMIDAGERPEGFAEGIEWDIARAFDAGTASFHEWYIKAWASDAIFSTVAEDPTKAVKVFSAWLDAFSQRDIRTNYQLCAEIGIACEIINDFCSGYCAIAGKHVMTPDSHDSFTKVFVSQKGEYAKYFKSLVFACRRNKDFQALEEQTIKCAPAELEHHQRFLQFRSCVLATPCGLDDEIVEQLMEELPLFENGFRPGLTDLMRKRSLVWLMVRADELVQLVPRDPHKYLATLVATVAHLEKFAPLGPPHRNLLS